MAESKQTSVTGGVKELNTEEHSQQDVNFKQMREEILEVMTSMISKLERTRDKSRELANMKSLYAVITSSKKKLKLETLMQFKEILKNLREKIDKVPDIQEYFSAGAEPGNITIGGELAKIPTRKEKRQSAVHVPNSITENHSSNLQAGKSNSSDDDKPSTNNEWLPSHKSSTVLQRMLEVESLHNLYKCMDNNCYWTVNNDCSFLNHLKNEHFNKKYSDWNHCSYCPFQGDGTPFDLVQHITKKHGHCQFQCPYCFFRGMACIYLVLHQNTTHINKLVKILLCTDVKVSPPAESELEPLASVVQPYICDQGPCNKKFYNPKDFQLHLQWQHNQVSTLTCHICKATHQNAAHLISHYKFHSFSLYQCRHCPHGAEKDEDILLHLCNMHHNLPALTVMRHYELTEMSAPGDVNQLKIVDLSDVSSRPSEAAFVAGGVMTSTQSQMYAEEGAAVKNQAAHILCSQVTESEIIDTVQNNSFEMVDNQVTDAAQGSTVSPISENVSLQKIVPLTELKVSSSLQETNIKGGFSDCSPCREQDAENNDSDDDDVDEDDDVQVLYCQLAMKSKRCNHMTCNGSCKLRNSQPGNKYLDNKLKNCVNELVKETDSQNSCDSAVSLTESCTGAAAKEESELTQEHTTREAFPASTTFSSKIPIENAESRFNIDSHPETNCSAESLNITCGADKAQTNQASEESAVTEAIVTQGDQRKLFTASGLSGEDLYLCGNSRCEYRARTGYQLQEHLYVCDLSQEHVLRCPHCSRPFKASNRLVNHLRIHGSPRYSCPLCTYRAVAATAVAKHLKLQHKVSYIETVPIDRFLNNRAMDMFAVRPQGEGKSKHKPTAYVAKTVYGPEEIQLLPMSAILKDTIECSVCSFKTKVCSRMKQHMGQHLNPDVDSAEISRMEVVNPVPCIEANGKMFDKTTGVAISSAIGVPKLMSSGTSSSSGSAVAAGAVGSLCKSRKEVQDAASASTSQRVKRAAAVRARASIRDLAEPIPSDSPVSSPKGSGPKRVAAVRARASIRDLAEPILYHSPVSSPEGLDIEEPVVENKRAFTSSSEKEKEPTSKKSKISHVNCDTNCINVHSLKTHIRKKNTCPVKWHCGYCPHGGSTEMAIKQHCRLRHHTMPVLVKHNEEVAPLKLENVMHHTIPELVKYSEEAASLKLDDEFSETNYELGTKSVTTASSASSSAQHAGSLPEEGHSQRELLELLTTEEACCKKLKDSRSSQTETATVKHPSTSSKLCFAGKYVCMLCCARTDSEEQFHKYHHSVHHPNVEPKYCFQTVSYKVKPTKFKCQKCSFFSDNFEILKEHLQRHIKAFQMWLCAQQCDLESSVVGRCQFSHEDCDVGELEIEHLKKLVMQRNMDDDKSLCPGVPGPEKKDMQSIPHRIQNVAHKLTGLSSVSDRPIIKSLSANKPESDDPSNESSYSHYGRSPSPIDENKLLVSVNCGGSGIRMSLSTFKKLCPIYPKVKVRDLKHEKFMSA